MVSSLLDLSVGGDLKSVFYLLRSSYGGVVDGNDIDVVGVLRNKLLRVFEELCRRFGFSESLCSAEWPMALVFAMVASASFVEPPIVLHVVGVPGTFKTLGARIVSEYIEVPILVLRYNGPSVGEIYRGFVELLSRFLGVSSEVFVNRVGGVVRWLHVSGNGLEIRLSLPYLVSYALRRGSRGFDDLDRFISSAIDLGFRVSLETGGVKHGVIDPAQQSNIDDYRMRYLQSELGLLTIMDVFDNYILVVDEGCRNIVGLGTLLTKMSDISMFEGLRIVIITDNPEQLFQALSNSSLVPLHDRTIKIFASEFRESGDLWREPSVKINALELLALKTIVERVEFPYEAELLLEIVKQSLRYKYTISYVEGVRIIKPLQRVDRGSVEIDPFYGIDLEFFGGGRFEVHTKMLAKFFAFLSGHTKVELEDLWKALLITIRSRLFIKDVSTFPGYKKRLVEVFTRLRELFKSFSEIMGEVQRLGEAIGICDVKRAEEIYSEIVGESNTNPFYLSAITALIRKLYISRTLNEKCLPENMHYTFLELMALEGDIFEFSNHFEIYTEILDKEARMEQV